MSGLVVRQETLRLAQWGDIELPVLLYDQSAFLPVKHLCFIMLGGMDDRSQRAKIKNDAILSNLSRLLPVQTPGGVQDMVCLERMGLARWINSLTLSTIRADLRPRIAQFQWDVAMAADRLLFGEVISPEPPRFAIVPDAPPRFADTAPPHRVSDSDVRRLIFALVDRMGRIEISHRELHTALLALASGTIDGAARQCPQCGYLFTE
jgi:antirepressor protein